MNVNDQYGLGRLFKPDPRDLKYLARDLVPDVADRSKTWAAGFNLNQGSTPRCVAFSETTSLMASPSPHRHLTDVFDPAVLYHQAQVDDEFPGEDYDGTTVRGGCKALQAWGLISEYRWMTNADEVAAAIVHHGPVVVGTNWYDDMFNPDGKGVIHVGGKVAGGHAYCLLGYNLPRRTFRVLNSWGRGWGQAGRAWLSQDDLQRLLSEDGEAAMMVEVTGKAFDAAVSKVPKA